MAGEERVLELREDGVLVAEHAGDQRLAGGDARGGVAPHLLLDGHGLPARLAQLAEGGGARHGAQPTLGSTATFRR